MPKPKILVIEDDRFLRKVYLTKLAQENFDAVSAIDGEEGLNKWKTEKPDLVLLDLILPKMNGFQVLEEAKNDPSIKDIPVIILSNLGQDSDIERGRKIGAIDYLVKANMSINDVVEKIGNYIKTVPPKKDNSELSAATLQKIKKEAAVEKNIFCSGCGKKITTPGSYCPYCGEKIK